MDLVSRPNDQSTHLIRKAWEDPQIVLERQLLVSAQDVAPGGPSFGVPGAIGPLSTSGASGNCL